MLTANTKPLNRNKLFAVHLFIEKQQLGRELKFATLSNVRNMNAFNWKLLKNMDPVNLTVHCFLGELEFHEEFKRGLGMV